MSQLIFKFPFKASYYENDFYVSSNNFEVLSEKKERDWSKLKGMIQYAYAETCRQQWILNYFGEKESSLCEVCDTCSPD